MGEGFSGWMRQPGRRWRVVCQCATHDDALAELLVAADRTPGPKDLVVLAAGVDPHRRPTKRVEANGADLFFANAGEAPRP